MCAQKLQYYRKLIYIFEKKHIYTAISTSQTQNEKKKTSFAPQHKSRFKHNVKKKEKKKKKTYNSV